MELMKYDLPENGCNVFNGSYVDNYYNNVRTRYYLNEGSLLASSTSAYVNIPNGTHCLTSNEYIYYKPELGVWFPVLSFALCLIAGSLIFKVILKRLLP